MNTTLSQAKAANMSPMTGVTPRTGSYVERDIQMRTIIKLNRKKEKKLNLTLKKHYVMYWFEKMHRKMLIHIYQRHNKGKLNKVENSELPPLNNSVTVIPVR